MTLDRPDPVSYREQLEIVHGQLAGVVERAEVRGEALAQFLYAENRGRAVEVYWDAGGICVEVWERDADAEPHQSLHTSYAEATRAAQEWLTT